jgi:3',5'-cyclic AMP phosphodiesterase CpdA
MERKIIHLSDLHFGTTNPQLEVGLQQVIRNIDPDVVVISGDLTQRARTIEFQQAHRFLQSLPYPQVTVPGNHDVTLFDLFRRFYKPLNRFKKYIEPTLFPFYLDDRLAILGVNTARSLTWKSGRISMEQVDYIKATLDPLPEQYLKILVTHHPIVPPPNQLHLKRLGRARKALERLDESRIDLILAGHYHMSYTSDTINEYTSLQNAVLVVQAGTALSHRVRKTPNSFNVLCWDTNQLTIEVWEWKDERYVCEKSHVLQNKNGCWNFKNRLKTPKTYT